MFQFKKGLLALIIFFLLLFSLISKPNTARANEDANFDLIPVKPFANHEIKPRYKNLPLGENLFGGIPFLIVEEENPKLLCTHADRHPEFPKEVVFLVEVNYPDEVYFLLNGGNTHKDFLGKKVGEINLSFSDDSSFSSELKVGHNIRDWILNDPNYVHEITDPNTKEVWRGTTATGAGPVIIDMLKISIPIQYQKKYLTKIILRDLSLEMVNNSNPALQFFGITIKYKLPPPKSPLLLIPGFGASFNALAILKSLPPAGGWGKTPFVKEYNNFKATFLNAGYEEGKNYFEFYYDWRKPIWESIYDLESYLESTVFPEIGDKNLRIVGHSMGGLLARAYLQNPEVPKDKIQKIVTVGSPHEGTSKAYRIWEGGQLDYTSCGEMLLGLLSAVNRYKKITHVSAIKSYAPSIQNFIPIYDFLEKDGLMIPANSISQKNDWLFSLKSSLTFEVKAKMVTIGGKELVELEATEEKYLVRERNWRERLFGLWEDGAPAETIFSNDGDLTVLLKSATISGVTTPPIVHRTHTELVWTEDGLKTILNSLGETAIDPLIETLPLECNLQALFFMLSSPANINVDGPTAPSFYDPENKIILIPNADSGLYSINITPVGDGGEYQLFIGQIINQKGHWFAFENQIGLGQMQTYQIKFDPENPLAIPLVDEDGSDFLSLAEYKIKILKKYWQEKKEGLIKKKVLLMLEVILKKIKEAQNFQEKEKFQKASASTKDCLSKIHQTRLLIDEEVYSKNVLKEATDLLTHAWLVLIKNSGNSISNARASRTREGAEKMFQQVEKALEKLNSPKEIRALSYLPSKEELDEAIGTTNQVYIHSFLSRQYSLETLKLILLP